MRITIPDADRDPWVTSVMEIFRKYQLSDNSKDALEETLIALWDSTLLRLAKEVQHKTAVKDAVLMDHRFFYKCLSVMLFLTRFFSVEMSATPFVIIMGATQLFSYHYANDERRVREGYVPPQLSPDNFSWLIEQQCHGDANRALSYLKSSVKEYSDAVRDAAKTESFVATLVMCFFAGLVGNTENLFSSYASMLYVGVYGAMQRNLLNRVDIGDVPHPMQVVFDHVKKMAEVAKEVPAQICFGRP